MTDPTQGVDELLSRIDAALEIAESWAQIDGGNHKAWVIDQMVRKLVGNDHSYQAFVAAYKDGDDGPETYEWDTGVAP